MTDLPEEPALAIYTWGTTVLRAQYEVDGGLEGGTVTVTPINLPEGVSRDEALRGFKSACGCPWGERLRGVGTHTRRAVARGDVTLELNR